MKAVRLIQTGYPLELQEIPIPVPGRNDVLVRIKAAGICHSDAHYRAGVSPVNPKPLTLGHEVTGVIEEVGDDVRKFKSGDRVCLHYLVTCGSCKFCNRGSEQFCESASMIGKYRDGGYAEFISIPAGSVFHLPDEIPFDQGAIMMCSAATSFHALKKVRLKPGETLAIFGIGGLGTAAIQIARWMGALEVYAVDINTKKLEVAEHFGAIPIDPQDADPVEQIKTCTHGRGVDVALELIGLQQTMENAIQVVSVFGRVGLVGLSNQTINIDPYNQLLMREAEIIGVADHLAKEIPTLIELVRLGYLDLSKVISKRVPLDERIINRVFDQLDSYSHEGRIVITP
jgi:propanol-preferring alcohol dehydrogenase